MRVHKIIRCPQYTNDEYDEVRYNGYGTEHSVYSVLKHHGFEAQKELKYGPVEAHVDFFKDGDYIEFVEVKNTSAVSYLHLLQVSMYKSLISQIYNKPVLGYLWYTKMKFVLGESVYRPQWLPDYVFYIFTNFEAGQNYVNYGILRSSYKATIAGPYCISCKAQCKIKSVILSKPEELISKPQLV